MFALGEYPAKYYFIPLIIISGHPVIALIGLDLLINSRMTFPPSVIGIIG
jgi:hypothetical protein